jgi:hypothetical protein
MKTLSLFSMLVLSSLLGICQNGGLASENSLVKMEFIGYSNGANIIKITNKQTCDVTVEYKVGHSGPTKEVSISGSGNWYLNVPAAINQEVVVKSRAKTFCGTNTDAGWTELTVVGNPVLPIVFGPITAMKVSPNLIKLTFEAEEDFDLKYYNILVSPDGKTWKKAQVLFPNGITGRKKYSILVKL